jgi:hypothetical protein
VSDANVVKLVQPGSFADPLTEVLRNGARALLAQAVEDLPERSAGRICGADPYSLLARRACDIGAKSG